MNDVTIVSGEVVALRKVEPYERGATRNAVSGKRTYIRGREHESFDRVMSKMREDYSFRCNMEGGADKIFRFILTQEEDKEEVMGGEDRFELKMEDDVGHDRWSALLSVGVVGWLLSKKETEDLKARLQEAVVATFEKFMEEPGAS